MKIVRGPGPFSSNYWKDWFLYHGIVFVISAVIGWMFLPWYGGYIFLSVAPIVGVLNAMIDGHIRAS